MSSPIDPEIKEGEYRCAICREIFAFVEGQEEKATEEARRKGFDPDNCLPVCDDCYKRVIWLSIMTVINTNE